MNQAARGQYVSVKGAKELTDMSVPFWRKAIAERRIACVRMGRSVKIAVAEIERFIAENTVPAAQRNGRKGRR